MTLESHFETTELLKQETRDYIVANTIDGKYKGDVSYLIKYGELVK